MIYYTENQIDDLRTVMAAKDAEIARLRDALTIIAYPVNVSKLCHMDAINQARAALAGGGA